MIEGIDYSSGGPLTSAQIKAAGYSFVGRYLVNDKSPGGRGIDATEYVELATGGTDVFGYWESSEGWMLGGYAAGLQAAINAQNNINGAGMPNIPVYFACDFDAAESDQPAIDDCLRGCAEVLGADRVGIYGGYWIVKRCSENKTAKWFCQTLAWSGNNWFPGNHLEQYGFDTTIAGVSVDLVRALQPNYGQASLVGHKPTKPVYVKRIPVPGEWETKIIDHRLYLKHGGIVTAAHGVKLRQFADREAPEVGPPLKPGKRVRIQYVVEGDGDLFYISKGGARMLAKGFVE